MSFRQELQLPRLIVALLAVVAESRIRRDNGARRDGHRSAGFSPAEEFPVRLDLHLPSKSGSGRVAVRSATPTTSGSRRRIFGTPLSENAGEETVAPSLADMLEVCIPVVHVGQIGVVKAVARLPHSGQWTS